MTVSTDVDVDGLDLLREYSYPVFVSRNGADRARGIADRTQRMTDWLAGMVSMPPIPPLFVLGPDDWHRAALVPHYGLAHVNRSRIVVGQEPSPFFGRTIDVLRPWLTDSDYIRLSDVYGDPPDFSPFADLLICHELTHLADRPSHLDSGDDLGWGVHPGALWFCELFANLGLQGYIATESPAELPALETLYEVISGTEPPRWRFTRLSEMYDAMTASDIDIDNYTWFEFRLQHLARRLWRAGGPSAFAELHRVLHGPLLTHDAMIDVLAGIDADVADQVREWL